MRLAGSFLPPGDKSISHRLALMSLLAEGTGRFTHMAPGADVKASLDAAESLGSKMWRRGEEVEIQGAAGRMEPIGEIDCGNSGTTMRILMGILAGREGAYILDGDDSLRRRPMERVAKPLRQMGAMVRCIRGGAPVKVWGGRLRGIHFALPVGSAQVKGAVLLAGIQAKGTTLVREPVPSRDHTERLLGLFGARVRSGSNEICVQRSILSMPGFFRVPGDPSSAAFFLCTAAVLPGSEVTAEGMLLNPTRTGYLKVLRRMGAHVEVRMEDDFPEPRGSVTVRWRGDLLPCVIDGTAIPSLIDEIPILALMATQALGTTVFRGAGELRFKETDRLKAIVEQLSIMGAHAESTGDSLVIHGPRKLVPPSQLQSYGDHRMAMTLRMAGVLSDSEPHIEHEACTAVSYPAFRETLEMLLR